jgi:hypothetical protein
MNEASPGKTMRSLASGDKSGTPEKHGALYYCVPFPGHEQGRRTTEARRFHPISGTLSTKEIQRKDRYLAAINENNSQLIKHNEYDEY